MTTPRDEWDDARLTAAFAARATAATKAPADLPGTVIQQLAAEGGRSRRSWSAAPGLIALTGVVLVAIVVGTGQRPGHDPASSEGPGISTPTERLSESESSDLIGAPLSVTDALVIQANTGDDHEIAVSGFLSVDVPMSCPFIPGRENPASIHCPESFQWLMERDETLWSTSGNATFGRPPIGPAFHPGFDLVDQPNNWHADGGLGRTLPVVLVGHFHDRRAALCPADQPTEFPCAETFVVDRVVMTDGATIPVSTRLDNTRYDDATKAEVVVPPAMSETDVDSLVRAIEPDAAVLSRQLLIGTSLTSVEPVLVNDGVLRSARLIWIVTTVVPSDGRAVARTFLVVDGTTTVIEVSADGSRVRGARSQSPGAS